MKEERKKVECKYYRDGKCWLNIPDSFPECKKLSTKLKSLPCIKSN